MDFNCHSSHKELIVLIIYGFECLLWKVSSIKSDPVINGVSNILHLKSPFTNQIIACDYEGNKFLHVNTAELPFRSP